MPAFFSGRVLGGCAVILAHGGKRNAENCSEISIRFKNPPQNLLRQAQHERSQPNWILLGIQPNDCLKMELQVGVSEMKKASRLGWLF